ncbi:hypothetical protein JTB14_016887 [Gonioctena quinquepunctata]|nr:hypothetical protein JTB14_016887 [Gonioctena quinquepunctata]
MSKENSLKAEELNFHHPDGGWGWFIVLASGLSNKFPSENETLLERGDSTKIQRKRSVISDAIYSFDVAGSSLIQSHRNKSKQSTHDLSEKWKSTKLLSEVLEHDTTNRERTTQPEILSTWKKISRFFDFELFKDPVYLNISVGITLANFVELNFSILTPIIMAEFNFVQNEIATFMSLLAATDIIVRFTIPFIADKIGWSNRIFFLIGVMSMAIGRISMFQGIALHESSLVGN